MIETWTSREWRVLLKIGFGDDCWLWRGATTPTGYGQVRYLGRTRIAHRLVYELLVGPIPEGLELDHLCRVRNCVRPDHLEPITHDEHVARTPPGQRGRLNAVKTCCPFGHPYDETNTRWRPEPRRSRECRTCDRDRYHRRRKSTLPTSQEHQ